MIDEVIVENNEEDRFIEFVGNIVTTEPIIIRGNGNFTLLVVFFLFYSRF